MLSAVVPAAGRAERFGGNKLLAPIRGEPLLVHTLRSLLDGGVHAIVVVGSPGADLERETLPADRRVSIVFNPEPARGMFSSIQAGLAAVSDGGPVLVLPGDMPFVKPTTVAVVAARGLETGAVVVPVHAGRRGHPVALPPNILLPLLSIDPASNLKAALSALDVSRIELGVDDPGILRDVDVRADLKL